MRKVLYILGQLNDSDMEWIRSVGIKRHVSPSEVLIEKGVPIDAVYIVLDGTLSVQAQGDRGSEIARLGSGDVVGEMSYIDDRPPLATVVALAPSLVLAIPREKLTPKLEKDFAFAARFYRALAVFLSYRLRDTVGMLGYGTSRQMPEESQESLDDSLLDTVYLAGARFDRLLKGVTDTSAG
ncbi:MAG TPA: cyclic nucleotide-binding domain-containing protein [Aggregatilineales bacterium]|nr:cyclic nucleotide-binding domain-containing protein [Aggregatilineales bacterium]